MSLSVFLKDDCLTSLTRFAAAHWTVSSLSAVQGHFCTLLACKFTTLCYFLQRYRYRKLLTEWLLVSITRLFLVVILSRRTRAGIFTSAPIHILSYRGKKKTFSFGLQFQDTFWEKHGYFAVKEFCWFFPAFILLLFRKIPRAKEKEAWSFTKEKWYAGTLKRRKLRLIQYWKETGYLQRSIIYLQTSLSLKSRICDKTGLIM